MQANNVAHNRKYTKNLYTSRIVVHKKLDPGVIKNRKSVATKRVVLIIIIIS